MIGGSVRWKRRSGSRVSARSSALSGLFGMAIIAGFEVNSIYGSTLASALGNQINVEAAAGSSVVINGNQINKGHQLAVTVIGEDYKDLVEEALDDFEDRK